jgi:hypothetical protein
MLPARVTFDYDVVPAVTAAALRVEAAQIRKLATTIMTDIIEAGRALKAVKDQIPGQFCAWVKSECGFSIGTAENYMRAAEFAAGRIATVTILNPRAVYLLAAKSAPPEIVQTVLDRAAKGETIADSEVIAALNEHRCQKREAERQQKAPPYRGPSKKLRDRWEFERLQQEKRQREEDESVQTIALSIIEGLGEENAGFLIDRLRQGNRRKIIDRLGEEITKRRQVAA